MKRFLIAARPLPAPAAIPAAAFVLALLTTACQAPPPSPTGGEFFRQLTPHEAHRFSLTERGLEATSLGSQWIAEAERSLAEPIFVSAPYSEVGRFVRPEADAVAYQVEVDRGERLEIRVQGEIYRSGDLLVDVFRAASDGSGRTTRIGGLEAGGLDIEPDSSSTYLVRLQPKIFGNGRYRVSVRTVPALLFPVAGRDNSAVWSRFGVERDGGDRQHEGVDIFAPRGTPVLAATNAVVRRVDVTPVGGKVVWLRDRERNRSIYYAHLDSQLVRDGQQVSRGDTLGLVGNTGNAITTPPHLHFGIYIRRRGAIDPYPFIELFPTELPLVSADSSMTGMLALASSEGARLRARPSRSGDVLVELDQEQLFRVVAASRDWYRVRLPNGIEGFVAEGVTTDPGFGRIAIQAAMTSSFARTSAEPEVVPTPPSRTTRTADAGGEGSEGGASPVQR